MCQARLFADDSSIISTGTDLISIENDVNLDLSSLHHWADDHDWLVTFNANKTDAMLFTNRLFTNYPSLIFGNPQLTFTNTHKHLGVTFNSSGKWEDHINEIINKCAKMIAVMRKMKMKLSRNCLNTMYLSFIRPVLEYADVVWDGCSLQNCNRLEKVQCEVARIVTGLTRSVSLDLLYKEVGWVPLSQRRKESKLITLFKIKNGFAPSYLYDLLPPLVGYEMQYQLRNRLDFSEPLCRLEIYKKSFIPSAVSLWNCLPIHIRNQTELNTFKRLVVKRANPVPYYYLVGDRLFSILHARIRNKCSNLNHDLFQNHIVNSPYCSCGEYDETAFHYFLKCPKFNNERADMIHSLHLNDLPIDINSLLYGNDRMTVLKNRKLFEIVENFIKKSKRFTTG